jgi:hypothetical protein
MIGMNSGAFLKSSGSAVRARRARTECPRPSASSDQWRHCSWLWRAAVAPAGLAGFGACSCTPRSETTSSFFHEQVGWPPAAGRRRGGGLLRSAAASSERSLRQLSFCVPGLPANPSLVRTRQARRTVQSRSTALMKARKKIDKSVARRGGCERARGPGAGEARLGWSPLPSASGRCGGGSWWSGLSWHRRTAVVPAELAGFAWCRCPPTVRFSGEGSSSASRLQSWFSASQQEGPASGGQRALRRGALRVFSCRSSGAVEPRAAPDAATKRLGPGGHLWLYSACSALAWPQSGRRR